MKVVDSFVNKICSFTLAAIMTIALLAAMNYLIKNDAVLEDKGPGTIIPKINSDVPEIIPIQHESKPIVKPVIRHSPPIVRPVETHEVDTKSMVPTFDPVVFDPPKNSKFVMNGQSLPMVKVAPEYPSVAVTKGIEGFVDVVFDVTETGATENIQIVYAEPAKIFNSAVVKAVTRWKYKPKMEEGVSMKMYGLRERIRFNMDK